MTLFGPDSSVGRVWDSFCRNDFVEKPKKKRLYILIVCSILMDSWNDIKSLVFIATAVALWVDVAGWRSRVSLILNVQSSSHASPGPGTHKRLVDTKDASLCWQEWKERRQSQCLLPLTQTWQKHVDTGLYGSLSYAPKKLKLQKRKAWNKSDITHNAVCCFSRGLCPPTEN